MRIAVLDDEPIQREHLLHTLKLHLSLGCESARYAEFHTGESLRRALRHDTFDLLILDWNLPGLSGVELLQWLRDFARSKVPVLMLSSRASERDVAAALTLGADDYLIKPFRPFELCARIQRLLLRKDESVNDSGLLRFGAWVLDPTTSMIAYVPAAASARKPAISLTDREFRLALTLFRNLGKVLSRDHLMEGAGYDGEKMTRLLDGLVFRLRSKLTAYAPGSLRMQTVYGQGYRLTVAEGNALFAPEDGGAQA